MGTAARKRCLLACDTAQGACCFEIELDATASIADALAEARRRWPQLGVDWDGGQTGIWGEIRPRDHVPREGERIELYRPLPEDPRVRRRSSVQRARRARR
ncbi:MAG: RnfH family protein [Steroidobacteraceae bacterium]